MGKTALLEAAANDLETGREGGAAVVYTAPALADSDHRALLAARLSAVLGPDRLRDPLPEWADLLVAAVEHVERERKPLALVLDDAHRILEGQKRWSQHLTEAWRRARSRALPFHVVLAGRGYGGLDALLDEEGLLAGAVDPDLHLKPLGPRTVASRFPGWSLRDRARAFAVFGGVPASWARCDPSVSLATNVRRYLLDASGVRGGLTEERALSGLQSPGRYLSLIRGLGPGLAEWAEILSAVPDFESGGRMAPYLQRLREMRMVRGERSLDASPRSRSRRYGLEDPHLAFRTRFLLPFLHEIEAGRGSHLWSARVRPGLDGFTAELFPAICRAWVREYGGEALPSSGRAVGGLWGEGYDIPVAGTLRTGATFYGRCHWGPDPAGEELVDRLDQEVRRTRYGFGREARLRVVFTASGTTSALRRRAARNDAVHLVELHVVLEGRTSATPSG